MPYYQRIVRLEDGETIGFEVLARWVHPRRGVLTSDSFISIAEDTGTIGKMTDLLIERAMRDAKDWPDHISIFVNFSPRQISDPNVATRILGLLTKVVFPPHRLVMEITETAVVRRLEEARATLQSLRNLGVAHRSRRLRHRILGLVPFARVTDRRHQDRPFFRRAHVGAATG